MPNYSGFAGLGWLELPVAAGKRLALDTAAVSVLGHARGVRVLQSWNARA